MTGVVVGCLRKLQRWSFFSIIEEVFYSYQSNILIDSIEILPGR